MWRRGYERVSLSAKQLYDVRSSNLQTSEHSSLDGFTFARVKTEGDNYFKQNPVQNYSKTMTKYRVGLSDNITWEMRKYDKYREIERVLSKLGGAAAQRLDLDLTHRFTFGTATSYVDMDGRTVSTTVGDGLALFSASHTVKGSSTTFRNKVANSPLFSRGGLEAAETLFAVQMIDSAGNKVVINPDSVITTDDPATVNSVMELLKSLGSPDGAHSGVENVYKGKYRHIVLPYLASDNQGARNADKEKLWMLASLSHSDALLEISEMPHMISPSPGSNAEEFDTDDWAFKASAAYGIEIVDPKWIVVSLGNGNA